MTLLQYRMYLSGVDTLLLFVCEIFSLTKNNACYLLFVSIPYSVSISVSIAPSGTNTAGETYSLVCSVTVTGSTDTPTITWLDPMISQVPSEMVSTTGSMSTLTFDPLSASYAGTYTCIAAVGGEVYTDVKEVTVQSELLIVLLIDSQNPLFCVHGQTNI